MRVCFLALSILFLTEREPRNPYPISPLRRTNPGKVYPVGLCDVSFFSFEAFFFLLARVVLSLRDEARPGNLAEKKIDVKKIEKESEREKEENGDARQRKRRNFVPLA